MITPRQRVEQVLRGETPEEIPFTIYDRRLPRCTAERILRNNGMCMICRDTLVFKTHTPNVISKTVTYCEDGKTYSRTEHHTPCGDIFSVGEIYQDHIWVKKKFFSEAKDYKPLLFFINDMVFEPNYEAFRQAELDDDGDGLFRGTIGLEPLQQLISEYMGAELFCMEWFDNQDEILKLYEALTAKRRQIYKVCADSPAWTFNYGGNVTPEILGVERFVKYYMPHYNEAAEELHKKGKLVGVHFDGNCKCIASHINSTGLDYIEAFTPAPDTDMTLADARKAWPNKILWINFPSSVHLCSLEEIEKTTEDLIHQAGTYQNFIMGITEDMPPDRWQKNLLSISKVLKNARKQ